MEEEVSRAQEISSLIHFTASARRAKLEIATCCLSIRSTSSSPAAAIAVGSDNSRKLLVIVLSVGARPFKILQVWGN